ncbi:DUF4190 domain-containing protein [Candidatus Woesearchaeota archaeon]|nr:DUF4190 domain-containing protein [Candidatus Woesearchaeota archaeon]MBT4110642.1 DUF4190 domain-containing protein [Candidatus Woesearchaeota archaeon]MBT4335834.1 DUF4190 domain-containing protein [Candidatus Woesearchaeota archaeon]MBT4469187.1 DUF4190 domain-containing protein [Candidatus Woesearchaeota archaeon]MBT6744494.1 DUF4190 domain-containing protein [Candidatus Woesearchaeota archaeon]
MGDSMDELEKRTSQRAVKDFDLETNEDFNLNLGESSEASEKTEEEVAPESKEKQKASVKGSKSRLKKYHHNPYEEKYHSEFSFMSLVLGIFGLILPLFSVLAVIFGIGGLMQTHREHMKGKWMAVLGMVLGFFGIVLIIVAIIFGFDFLKEYLLKFGSIETLVGAAHVYIN